MSPSRTAPRRRVAPNSLLSLMARWPQSWAGFEADLPFGTGLVAEMRPFVLHLEALALTPKTVRRHLNNLWAIGGEIIRRLHDQPELRDHSPRAVLLEAVELGEAPLLHHAGEDEQRALDATARRLLRFLGAGAQ